MLKLKSKKLVAECSCEFTLKDETGYKLQPTDTGFTPEGVALAENTDYHLDDGVFLNILYLDGDDGKERVLNDSKIEPNGEYISVDSVNTFNHCLTSDGLIYSFTGFLMTKDFYEGQPTNWFDSTKEIMFYDPAENKIVYRFNGADLDIKTFQDFIVFASTLKDIHAIQGLTVDLDYCYNICNIVSCQQAIMELYLDKQVGYNYKTDKYRCPNGDCDSEIQDLMADMEFLRTLISVLRYLLECYNYNDADKLLRLISQCNSICSKYSNYKVNRTDCGCS